MHLSSKHEILGLKPSAFKNPVQKGCFSLKEWEFVRLSVANSHAEFPDVQGVKLNKTQVYYSLSIRFRQEPLMKQVTSSLSLWLRWLNFLCRKQQILGFNTAVLKSFTSILVMNMSPVMRLD